MKKQNKTEAETAAAVIAEQIIENAKPAPSVKALMYRITALTTAAARRVTNNPDANRAEVFGYTLRAIEETAAQYWKHHAHA